MNAPSLHEKITEDDGLAARLAASDQEPGAIVEELYLRIYCRPPTDDERAIALTLFDEPDTDRRKATEDLLWALINSAEFLFIN
jgi:hypothetical protein